jgi:hypothetical protein
MKRLMLTMTLIAMPVLAAALEPINTEKHINDTLRAGFIADRIDDECSAISARK